MISRRASLLVLALVPFGCGAPKRPTLVEKPPSATNVPADPNQKLYQQMRTGTFQLSSAQDSLQTAIDQATQLEKTAGGTAAHGFSDLLKKLNAAGQKLGDSTEEVPSFEEFKKDIATQDDNRLNAIQGANDSLGDLADGQDIVDNLLAGAPEDVKPAVQKIQDQLDETVDAIENGVTALGGQVESEPDAQPGTAGVSAGG